MSDIEQYALVEPLDKHLAIPVLLEKRRTASYFTEAGLAKFGQTMNDIARVYDADGLFEVRFTVTDVLPTDNIAYQDEYQVLIFI